MNQLETNLSLWAICSIILFEILFIVCLCRCCFNRIKPKRFYVKREEYEYLHDPTDGSKSKYVPTILRPPHADDLAFVGTVQEHYPTFTYRNGVQNFGFFDGDDDLNDNQHKSPIETPSTPQNWIELKPQIIHTSQVSSVDYETQSYPIENYSHKNVLPHVTLNNIHSYPADHFENNQMETQRFQPTYQSNIPRLHVHRMDTGTESLDVDFSNMYPKSILKPDMNTATIPSSFDFIPDPSWQTQFYLTPIKNDDTNRISVKTNTDQQISIDHSKIDRRISIQPMLLPATSAHRMNFARINQLNEVEWDIPSEFQTIVTSNDQTLSSISYDSVKQKPWATGTNFDAITQQKAFEY